MGRPAWPDRRTLNQTLDWFSWSGSAGSWALRDHRRGQAEERSVSEMSGDGLVFTWPALVMTLLVRVAVGMAVVRDRLCSLTGA